MNKSVKCPRCGKETVYAPENPYRPFCSERCQLIDLGDWASEKYGIPTEDSGPEDTSQNDESKDRSKENP